MVKISLLALILILIGSVGTSLLWAGGEKEVTRAEAGAQYTLDELRGTTIRIFFYEEPFGLLIRNNMLKEFEKATGIKVIPETVASHEKITAELVAESGYYNGARISASKPVISDEVQSDFLWLYR